MHRWLVLRRGGLGDTLLMLPVLRALARAHPRAERHFAGVADFAAVLAAHGACERVWSSEDLPLWAPERAATRLAGFDLVCADDPALARFATPATRVMVFDPRPRDSRPLGLQLAAQLELVPRWPEDGWLRAPRPAARHAPVVLAPGSGGRAKCWPRAHWLALAASMADHDLQVVVGPVERERDDPRAWPWPVPPTFVVEPTVTGLAARLGAAAVFVGNDSGPSHLAAALGVPAIVLFGPSDPRVWGPVGPHVQALSALGGLTAILPEAVVAAMARYAIL